MAPGAVGHMDEAIDPYRVNGQIAMDGEGNWYEKNPKRGIDEDSIEPFENLQVQFPN